MADPRILVLLAAAVIAGCDSPPAASSPSSSSSSSSTKQAPEAPRAEPAEAPIVEVPVTMFVEQRSTTPIPGSDGKLSLTIDDITQGQVAVSVLDAQTKALAGPVSLAAGQVAPFRVSETTYQLRLEKLSNALVGSDFATFSIDVLTEDAVADAPVALTEPQKIERLIAAVASLQGAAFIRNGDEYTAARAAEHLRTKLSAAGNQIQTAQDFIDHIASGSSLSGEEYQIRFADGRTINARQFLQQELKKLATAPAERDPTR